MIKITTKLGCLLGGAVCPVGLFKRPSAKQRIQEGSG